MDKKQIKKDGLLKDKLINTKSNNVIYVDYYYFVLAIDNRYEFYLNPNHLIAILENNEISKQVIEYLENKCPKFENFYKNEKYDINKTANWKPNKKYAQNIPRIGNAYSLMIYKIITEKDIETNQRIIHLHQDYGPTLFADFKTINEKELQAFLTMSIHSESEKYIKSIHQLDCFKNIKMKNTSKTIIGAIAGDIIGSVYELNNVKTIDFELFTEKSKFTDDTVLTVAIADCIMNNKDFTQTVWEYGRKYRHRGYGGRFKKWLQSDNPYPYKSFGNGSAMRVSAVGFAYNDIKTVLEKAKETAEITHNHEEGIKGAQAIASSIFLARSGKTKQDALLNVMTKMQNKKLDNL